MVMLIAGVEIAGVGTLLMTGAARGRLGRGGMVSIGLEHLASLGLLVAAVQLLASTGTTDFVGDPRRRDRRQPSPDRGPRPA